MTELDFEGTVNEQKVGILRLLGDRGKKISNSRRDLNTGHCVHQQTKWVEKQDERNYKTQRRTGKEKTKYVKEKNTKGKT